MTDKQIIIDDVDISECEYRSKLLEGVCTFYGRCVNTFCPYKAKWLKEQLLRKEQECEKAKQNAQDTYDLWQALIESFNILQGEKIKLEQECEELKECKEDLTQRLCDMNAHKTFEIVKLKQILTEIKEIIKFNKTNRLSGGGDISIEQILQKINECEME